MSFPEASGREAQYSGLRTFVFEADPDPQCYFPVIFNDYCPDYFDDFSNPATGWPFHEDEKFISEYLDGEYRIGSVRDGSIFSVKSPACTRESYSVEVEARWVGDPGISYGIVFGVTEDFNHYYRFEVNTDGQKFRLFRVDDGVLTRIVASTFSAAINAGTESNHLKVIRDGTSIILNANDIVLGAWSDSSIVGKTGAGVLAGPYQGKPVSDARFDNFQTGNY